MKRAARETWSCLPETGSGRVKCGTWFNIGLNWKRRFMIYLNCGGQYLERPGNWNEAELRWVRDVSGRNTWLLMVDLKLSLISPVITHITLMTSSNFILFIANAFQISPAQGSPLNHRFMDIISWNKHFSLNIWNRTPDIPYTSYLLLSTHRLSLSVSCNLYFQLLMSKIVASSLILLLFYSHPIHQKISLALLGSSHLSSYFLIPYATVSYVLKYSFIFLPLRGTFDHLTIAY